MGTCGPARCGHLMRFISHQVGYLFYEKYDEPDVVCDRIPAGESGWLSADKEQKIEHEYRTLKGSRELHKRV